MQELTNDRVIGEIRAGDRVIIDTTKKIGTVEQVFPRYVGGNGLAPIEACAIVRLDGQTYRHTCYYIDILTVLPAEPKPEPFSIATVKITGEGRFAGLYANIIGGCGVDCWTAKVIGSDSGPIVITSSSFEVVAVVR